VTYPKTTTAAFAALLCAAAACSKGENPPPAAAPPAAAPATPPPASGVAASNGQAVFARTCQTCHQANGQGMPGTYPPQAGSPYVTGDKTKLIRIALNGLQGPITVEGKRYSNVMPPWKSLSDADMAAVLTYVRSNFGNSASAVTPDEVAHERAATASRTTMWTVQELERGK
jgi:mono/diheme cytochrome c family protein